MKMRVSLSLIGIVGLLILLACPYTPRAIGASMGVEWINDFPGTADDRDHWDESGDGFYNNLAAIGWTGKFHWTNWNAFEKDFKKSPGWEESYADDVDIAMACTHGSSAWDSYWGRTNHSVYFGSTVDDHHLVPGDAYRSYGDNNLEWICFDSCSVLADRSYWHTTFDGLHLMLGFANTMYVISYGDGKRWTEYMIDNGWWDWSRTVTQAWFSTVDDLQPSGVKARVLAEVYDNYNDYLHGQGYVSGDPTNNGWYWYWDHTAGSEPPLQASALSMMLYEVIPETVDNEYLAQMARNFELPANYGEDRENFYLADDDGRVLTVDRFQGSFRYHNLKKLWKTPSEPRPIKLPGKEQAMATARSYLADRGLLPQDAYLYRADPDEQVEIRIFEFGSNEQGGPGGTVHELREEETNRIATNYQVEFARHLPFDGTSAGASVMGPGAKLKVYIGEGGEVIGAHGGWKTVKGAGTVAVMPEDSVRKLFDVFRNKIALEQLPHFDFYAVKQSTLGYYERRLGEAQNYLIPCWILDADFYTVPADGPPGILQAAIVPVVPDFSGYIYLPAAEEFIPLVAEIDRPLDGSRFVVGDTIVFHGQAQFGVLPYVYRWSSDVDGYLGEGQEIKVNSLSVARREEACIIPHTITVAVTDSAGNAASDSIKVTILPKPCEGDYDQDCDVDGSDLAKFIRAYSAGAPAADLNGDGKVNLEDVKTFAADFGRTDCPCNICS
ncbi:MAG: DUF6345 domain-containing protein [Pseudomonadota bacterium]